jgi:hypothetical protein
MTPTTKRRKRRREKAKLRNVRAVRAHREQAGRTGAGFFSRRQPSKQAAAYSTQTPNPAPNLPPWWR